MHTLQTSFMVAIGTAAINVIADMMQLQSYLRLTPYSQEYFRRTRRYACRVEDLSTGQQRVEHWEAVEAGFKRIATWFEKNGEGSQWVMGDTVTFADFALAAWIIWIKQVAEADEWAKVAGWNDGRWSRYLDGLSHCAVFDEGEVYKQ
jgi:glutathione S-transferase